MLGRIAVRRPLERRVRDPGVGAAAEGVYDRLAGCVAVRICAAFGLSIEPGQARPPAGRVPEIVADMHKSRAAIHAIARAAGTRESVAVAGLDAKLDEDV